MSDVKFECPACGQRLECSRACSGDIIHCPRCCAEIRVPFSAPGEIEGSVARAELVTPAAPTMAPPNESNKTNSETSNEPVSKPAQPKEIICPVCQSELRVPLESAPKAGGKFPIAELIRKGSGESKVESGPGEPHPDFAHMSAEERERQIAHAREAHPVQLYPAMKPRLDYVLSGKPPTETKQDSAPKAPKENEAGPEKSQKSLNE
jgi:hypothetical protein